MLKFNTIDELKTWQANGVVAGFVPNLEIDLYHHPECPGYSKTSLDKIEESPAALRTYKEQPPEPKDWGNVGNAVHTAILEPNLFEGKYVRLERGLNFAMKAGKDAKAQAESEGKVILKHDDYESVLGMREAAKSHKFAKEFLYAGDGITEGSAFWVNPETGVLCKTRPDRFRDDLVTVEIKTTDDASKFWFQRAIAEYRYAVQAAFQLDGMRECIGKSAKYFVIVAIEKKAPYHIMTYVIEPQAVEYGRRQYLKNLEQIKACQFSGVWPRFSDHYPEELMTMDLPNYLYERELQT